jgi:hypothetical protein
MRIAFISSMAVVTQDPAAARTLLVDIRGLPLERNCVDSSSW